MALLIEAWRLSAPSRHNAHCAACVSTHAPTSCVRKALPFTLRRLRKARQLGHLRQQQHGATRGDILLLASPRNHHRHRTLLPPPPHRRPTAWCSPWYVFASHSRLSRRSETSASASSHGSRVTWVHRGRLCNFRRLESERRRVAGVEFYAYSSGKLSALRRRPALGLGRRRGAVLLVGSLTHSLTSLWRWDNIVHCRVSE